MATGTEYSEDEHFKAEHWKAKAGIDFLQQVHERQKKEMRDYLDKQNEKEKRLNSPNKLEDTAYMNAIEKMADAIPEVDVNKLFRNMRRWIRLYMKRVHKEETMESLFATFDKDGNGVISKKEFYTLLLDDLDLHLESFEVDALLRHFDRDGNGTIDFDEFITQMKPKVDGQQKHSGDIPRAEQKRLNAVYSVDPESPRASAAIVMQRVFRGHLGRMVANEKFLEQVLAQEELQRQKDAAFLKQHSSQERAEKEEQGKMRALARKSSEQRMMYSPFTTKHGATPFLLAAIHGDLSTMQNLKRHSASRDGSKRNILFEVTNDGESALHLACGAGHTDIVEWLLAVGLSPAGKTYLDYTPFAYAKGNGHEDICALLEKQDEEYEGKYEHKYAHK